MSRISEAEFIPIAMPTKDSGWDADRSVDTVFVRITDYGRRMSGACDAPPGVVKAFIAMPNPHIWSRNMVELLTGADSMGTTALQGASTMRRDTPAAEGTASTRCRRRHRTGEESLVAATGG